MFAFTGCDQSLWAHQKCECLFLTCRWKECSSDFVWTILHELKEIRYEASQLLLLHEIEATFEIIYRSQLCSLLNRILKPKILRFKSIAIKITSSEIFKWTWKIIGANLQCKCTLCRSWNQKWRTKMKIKNEKLKWHEIGEWPFHIAHSHIHMYIYAPREKGNRCHTL